jgi:hypothetical protein
VVVVTSRLGRVTAAPRGSDRAGPHLREHPFFRRYGVNLPSSLTRDHSSTLAYSASRPVSVCGTGTPCLPSRPFVAVQAQFPCWGVATPARTRLSVNARGDLPPRAPYQLGRRSSRRGTCPPASGLSQTARGWYRTIDLLSIGVWLAPAP